MSKLRLIQAGVGGMGKAWWTTATKASPDFDLVAIVDVSDAALNECGDTIGVPHTSRFKTLESALNAMQADAVLTVTPPPVHVEHAELVFSRGLHLLTEKPIAHDLPAAKRMVDLAKLAGKQLMVTQNYRYNAPMTALRELMSRTLWATWATATSTFTSRPTSPERFASRWNSRFSWTWRSITSI